MAAKRKYTPRPHSKEASGGKTRVRAPVWTEKERQFAAAVLRHGNLARAAREAYPDCSVESSRHMGSDTYHRPHVKAYIEDENREMLKRYNVTAENIIAELAKLGFGNITSFLKKNAAGESVLDINEATELELAMVQEATIETYMDGKGEDARPVKSVKVKLMPKIQALELLGKKLKMFTDKVELSGSVEFKGIRRVIVDA